MRRAMPSSCSMLRGGSRRPGRAGPPVARQWRKEGETQRFGIERKPQGHNLGQIVRESREQEEDDAHAEQRQAAGIAGALPRLDQEKAAKEKRERLLQKPQGFRAVED